MKYGLLTFKNTENIGDDIQSYVAIRFLPKIDYYIEREKLDLFVPKNTEKVITIMNGWFLHSKINFPISPYIYPIYVSTHFSAYNSGGISDQYLSGYAKEILKKEAPIGCRDSGTMKLLEKNNIENYFSGCLTLSIEKTKGLRKKHQICLVDIDKKVEEQIRNSYSDKYNIITKTHTLAKEKNSKLTWNQRFKNVKNLLDTYQTSKIVVTSRLHCALPCLALGTPVLLIYDEEKAYTKDRLSDYAKILNHMSTKEFLEEDGLKKLEELKTNPSEYKKIREKVISIVNEKIKLDKKTLEEQEKLLPSIDIYKLIYVKPKESIDYLYQEAVNSLEIKNNDYINLEYERDYWKKEFNILLEDSDPIKISMYKDELNRLIHKYESLSKENTYLQNTNKRLMTKGKKI